jgi:hypothetical protein
MHQPQALSSWSTDEAPRMTPAHLRLLIIAGAVLLTLGWFLWWNSATVQADRTFGRLKAAIERGSANGVLENLHRDYDLKTSWPSQIGDEAGGMVNNSALRLLVLRGLTALFQLQSTDPFILRYTLAGVEPQEDGTVVAIVTLDLATTAGHRPLTFTPSLTNQRFVLASEGWWPALYVRSHPPFNVAY